MRILLLLLPIFIFLSLPLTAAATSEEYQQEAEERKNDPVESNERENWPQGPSIGAASAVLMDADTGALLYAKNIDERLFPASTTKLMTCLVAYENCSLDELITISQAAIDANDPDGSHMYLTAGEQLTLEELLYGIIINSANEACNAVGEHIGGSIDGFVDMMNAKAAELGCTNTHFVTTNGLHDEAHYTSAHDLALIARAFFSHEILSSMACTSRYIIPETELHGEHSLRSKNKLYPDQEYAYEGLLGSKTGFTSNSRQTLVSCAQRGNLRLVCVIMREESPAQFTDTVELFDYGFTHFSVTNADELEGRFRISNSDFFNSAGDIFGSTKPLVSIEKGTPVLLPDTLTLEDLDTDIRYISQSGNIIGEIDYSYQGIVLGKAPLILNTEAAPVGVRFTTQEEDETTHGKTYINIYQLLSFLIGIGLSFVLLTLLLNIFHAFLKHQRKLAKIKRNRSRVVKTRSELRREYHHGASVKKKRRKPAADSPYLSQSAESRRSQRRYHEEQKKNANAFHDKRPRKPVHYDED